MYTVRSISASFPLEDSLKKEIKLEEKSFPPSSFPAFEFDLLFRLEVRLHFSFLTPFLLQRRRRASTDSPGKFVIQPRFDLILDNSSLLCNKEPTWKFI